MKRLIVILLLFFQFVVFSATIDKKVDYKLKDISLVSTVSLEFVNGKATVIGTKRNYISVKGTISVRGDDQALCEDILKNARLKVKKHGDEVEISLNYDELKKKFNKGGFFGLFCSWEKQSNIFVDLEVRVPSKLNIEFSGVNFELNVENVKNAELSNVNGNVSVKGAGRIKCESVNGNIMLKDVRYKANCEVVNGNIKIETESPRISSISFESVNGNAEIKLPFSVLGNVDTESLTSKTTLIIKGKKTISKNLEWKGDGNCDISVQTINGRILIEAF